MEMVLVLILLAVLTVAAAPGISSIVSNASESQADYVVSQIRSALKIRWASSALINEGTGVYPAILEAGSPLGPCTQSGCFGGVLEIPIFQGWAKLPANKYRHLPSQDVYVYDGNGNFELQ